MESPPLGPTARQYSVQHVARLLGLRPATLRSWERRYGIPRPARAPNGYRTYTDADLRLLRRLQARLEAGVRIGLAVEELRGASTGAEGGPPDPSTGVPAGELLSRMVDATARLDELETVVALDLAFAGHPTEVVLSEILRPLLYRIGEAWAQGRLPVAAEHFTSALLTRRLISHYSATPEPWRSGQILAVGAPREHHELALLFLALALRRRGWDVRYLGVGMPLDEIEYACDTLSPDLVALSATRPLEEPVRKGLPELAHRLSQKGIGLVLGGQAFEDGRPVPGALVLGGPLDSILAALESRMEGRA